MMSTAGRLTMAASSLALLLFFNSSSASTLNLVTQSSVETADSSYWGQTGTYRHVPGNPVSGSYAAGSPVFTAGASPTDIALLARTHVGSFSLDPVSVNPATIPDPSTLLLLGIGLLSAGFIRKKTLKKV